MTNQRKKLKQHHQDMFKELLEWEERIYTLETFINSPKFISLKNKASNKHIKCFIKKLEYSKNYKDLLKQLLIFTNDDVEEYKNKIRG